MLPDVISRLRASIAVCVALVVTVLSLGRVGVSWSGRPAAQDGSEDPGRAVTSRTVVR